MQKTVQVIDSHTEGEPTRVVVAGGPSLGAGTLQAKADRFYSEYRGFQTGTLGEPRGSDVIVGALLLPPSDPNAAAAVIFYNNAGNLGMCGHGTIGLVTTLRHTGHLEPGVHRIETPVGTVEATLRRDGSVSVRNVLSYRLKANVTVDVPGFGPVVGDIAWGGNWFFLVSGGPIPVQKGQIPELLAYSTAIKTALATDRITGKDGAEIDHVEIFGTPERPDCQSKNFVLCPGNAYDRSPCGTGTSAKLACLAADGKLAPGDTYGQESIIGSAFTASYERASDGPEANGIIPTITGHAYITATAELLFDVADPFREGILP